MKSNKPDGVPKQIFYFSVFDTLLIRLVEDLGDLFLLLGKRLAKKRKITCSAEIFARQRANAEKRAATINKQNPSLHSIYQELLRSLELPPALISDFIKEELEIVRELSAKFPQAEAALGAARAQNATIVFLARTCLPSDFVQSLLEQHNLWQPGDRVFVSCERNVEEEYKQTFPPGVGETNAILKRFIKDNKWRENRLLKLAGKSFSDHKSNRYEQALQQHSFLSGGLASLFAGAARLTRLQMCRRMNNSNSDDSGNSGGNSGALSSGGEREAVLVRVAAAVMAPTLTAWVLWILRRAAADGCRRLYFVSRDGQILLQIAERLERFLQTGIELRYLYGSRLAVQGASEPEQIIEDAFRLDFCTLDDIVKALALTKEEILELLPHEFRDSRVWSENLTNIQRRRLTEVMRGEQFQNLINQNLNESRESLFAYLEQEGWKDDVPFALIDVGWRGSMARALAQRLAGTSFHLPSRFYYFGLGDDAHKVVGGALVPRLDAWFFDDAGKHGYLPYLPGNTSLIEMFCAADHGQVIGYERRGEKIVPRLKEEKSVMYVWGLPLLHETTNAFVDNFLEIYKRVPDLVDIHLDVRDSINQVLKLFWLHPTRREADYWGTFPVEVNFNSNLTLRLIEPLSFALFIKSMRSGKFKIHYQHSWLHGTAATSTYPYRLMLSLGWWARDQIPRYRNRLKWLNERIEMSRLSRRNL